jgi:hypothetical protein
MVGDHHAVVGSVKIKEPVGAEGRWRLFIQANFIQPKQ